jgi:hypothetical protein
MGEILSGRLFSPGTLVSSTNKTVLYNITEILLKVALIKHISSVLNKKKIFITKTSF